MTEPAPRSSPTGNLLLLVGSVLVTLLFLAAVEGGLRLLGIGAPDPSRASRLKYQQIYFPILEPAQLADGTPVYRTADRRLPYQRILREKPASSLRVFSFGGSATAGLGYSPNATFSRELARMLERAYPDRRVEVLNLGIVALASKQVKLLVAEAARRYEPDLVLVYSGNNEFLELHAEKFAEARAGWTTGLLDALIGTNLYRTVNRAIRGAPKTPSLADQDLSHDDLRVTQNTIIQEVEVSSEEIAEVVARYRDNIDAMAAACAEANTRMIPMTVAANWEWRGREDLPEGWAAELVGGESTSTAGLYARARRVLDERIASAGTDERYDLLFRRAAAAAALGDFGAAREDYRASMNEDPHLRRALDRMADSVRAVAQDRRLPLFDTIEHLSEEAESGIVGFDDFYDYVHLTPQGNVRVAEGLFRKLVDEELVPAPTADFALDAYVAGRLADLEQLAADPLDVGEWLGIGFDPARVGDRDLWKYDRMVKELEERIEKDPEDVLALVYLGNAAYFRIGGAKEAEAYYRRALALADRPEIRSNLARLRSEGRR